MTVIHILMALQYLYNNHVTYYVITKVNIRLGLPFARRTMVRNYVRRNVNSRTASQIFKVLETGVQTSYVHSSIISGSTP